MIHIRKSADGQFYFTINAGNGKVVAVSEMYKSKQSAHKGIKAVAAAAGGQLHITDHTKKA